MTRKELVLVPTPRRWRRLPVVPVQWLSETPRIRQPRITEPGYRRGCKPGNFGILSACAPASKKSKRARPMFACATTATCGSSLRMKIHEPRICARCGGGFLITESRYLKQRHCSRQCGITAAHEHARGRTTPWQERFWRFVPNPTLTDCWEWTGARNKQGYGTLMISKKPHRTRVAHRASWEIHNGSIPDGLKVCHHCDNPPCVNPAHLFVGTQAENVEDMIAKGRWGGPSGTAHRWAKFSDEKIREVRALREAGLSFGQIAQETGVSKPHAQKIVRGEWRRAA